MKIARVETRAIAPRWLLVLVETDEGLTGVGEALGDKLETVTAAVGEFSRYLTGKDPRRIQHHWQAMYRGAFWRGGPVLNAAISGVEIALWDILGKSLGVPCYQLLGGKTRDRIRIYGHVGGETPEKIAESARRALEGGLTAIKLTPFGPTRAVEGPAFVEAAVAKVRAVREAVGGEIDIMIDMHGRLSPAMAVIFAEEFAPFRPLFIEEPCLPENVPAMARVAEKATVPVATGERLFTRFGFREILEKNIAAVIQPDLCICGGLLEGRLIAAMAEAYYVTVAPHCPYGPVLLAASLQLDACIPNFLIQEQVSLGEGVFKEPFEMTDGHIAVPEKPGLGIELDMDAIAKRPYVTTDVPTFRHEDGSVADW